jgi:hypothetical protein
VIVVIAFQGNNKNNNIEIYSVLDGEEVDFLGMVKTLGTAIIMTPLIAILECIALSKAFGKKEPPLKFQRITWRAIYFFYFKYLRKF